MAEIETQATKGETFRALHRGPKILLLPNAWDVASARVFEEAGISAIATTSAGVAFTLGYPDGEKISREETLVVVARIAAAVRVPVTADVEAGYGDRPEDAARTARGVIEAGAVGMNLEDGTDDPDHPLTDLALQLEKIAAVRETAAAMGVPIVLNARTDVYLSEFGPAGQRYAESVKRLKAFRDAGADSLFAPGLALHSRIAKTWRGASQPGVGTDTGDAGAGAEDCGRTEEYWDLPRTGRRDSACGVEPVDVVTGSELDAAALCRTRMSDPYRAGM